MSLAHVRSGGVTEVAEACAVVIYAEVFAPKVSRRFPLKLVFWLFLIPFAAELTTS